MKKILYLLIFAISRCLGQTSTDGDIYVPIKISYLGYYRIDWEDSLSKDIWFKIMNYRLTNPSQFGEHKPSDPEEFKRRSNQLLFTRDSCEFVVKDYVRHVTDHAKSLFQNRFVFGEGAYYVQKGSGDRIRFRCVCLPAKMIAELSHGEQPNYRGYTIFLEPKPFVETFRRFKLDSLDLAEAPYFTIFPVDINPSFDCSKAVSPVEKAICRSAQLANLDRRLAAVYRKTLVSKANKVREDQRVWIEEREKACENKSNAEVTAILMGMYRQRIEELEE
ncbi:lysozyme inhibitor LprI family protein [Marinilongibacter aquaticus]|uniref:lysozyme inhibitor LprI family protein n=1 Tax=Marinilongibacter aquaticus TaxID=2975157 RepID=UPI0021BDCA7A|nr:lysozyme inhibitor LprI family protein [Marinilongibacter aquaticus]UBM60703.1 lysozyme inhibitor LprI family protein [Marinilongibacter aquaticus]